MANNEVSGPVVTTALAKVMSEIKERRFTYRFVFAPETIGPLVYMSEHLENLQERVQAGWVVTCVGDRRTYSYLASRTGSTLADRISLFALHDLSLEFRTYSFLQRGSDERQWNSPGANLPFCSLMRSKYGEYPEYHTSLDDLSLISGEGLAESLTLLLHCVYILENNRTYVSTVVGEPQLGRRGLYSTLSRVGSADDARTLLDVLAYCDGRNDLVAISRTLSKPFSSVLSAVETLKTHALLKDA